MKTFNLAALALLLSAWSTPAAPTAAKPAAKQAELEITLSEHLGVAWPSSLVHRTIAPKSGQFLPNRVALFSSSDARQLLPVQLTHVTTNPDGSVKSADVWFRTDLPAKATKTFVLREISKEQEPPASDLKITQIGNVLEISNAVTAVRLPAGVWSTPDGASSAALAERLQIEASENALPGPLLGVRLPSGAWTAASRVTPKAENKFIGYSTKILESGPIQARARVEYRFENGGNYAVEVRLRQGDSLVRVDERYEKAGNLSLDLGANLGATKFATKADYRGNMQVTPIDYSAPKKIMMLTGWDIYIPDRTSVLGLMGGPKGDLLAWMSTDADWLPAPYRQMFDVNAAPGGKLTASAPLENGHRHWGLLVGKGAAFPDAGRDLYKWHTKNIFVPLDKVVNWQFVWPDMEKIEFPHTFFSKEELPAIRARLHTEPAITSFMDALLAKDDWWASMPSVMSGQSPEQQEKFKVYREKFEARKGLVKGISYVGAAYLYSGEKVYLDQLNDRSGLNYERAPAAYLDYFLKSYTDDIGELADSGQMGNMLVSDMMLTRYVGLELLLGSGVLQAGEKRDILSKLAFMTYVMHESHWQPAVHMPDGSVPEGYGQGTPNQKHVAFSVRAINASMLQNHPAKKEWMKFAMAEVRGHYPWTIHESGALLESPFYSARDTMRYAPFWSAMTRAGVSEVAPDYKKWMERPKKAFAYLANMLTPPEPRMGGRRVYHPIGRSNPGVVDPTFMIGGDPWGLDDPQHASLMRWAWEQQGKPSPDVMGTTGGRDLSLTLIAFSHMAKPLTENPLHSRRYEGMGAVLRSNAGSDFESNIVWRHDPFAWDLYPVNNGAVYFYGKGAPLLPRFGGYWASYGGANMMSLPFGNRLEFEKGDNDLTGHTTEFASLGELADIVSGNSGDLQWTRRVLLSKDLDKADLEYLLVRDDVSRPDSASHLNWWFMTKNVAPDGLNAAGVVPIQISHEAWVANMGHNWKDAPKLSGQTHHFPGMTGVDVDLFIASPSDPQILTDAASASQFPYNVAGRDLFETQQLVRISQPAGKGYLSLIVPRWPGSTPPQYRAIADGAGVAITHAGGEDRLFLSDKVVAYKDAAVDFEGRSGFARRSNNALRLMADGGRISADGISLSCPDKAALIFADGKIKVFSSGDPKTVVVTLSDALKATPVSVEAAK